MPGKGAADGVGQQRLVLRRDRESCGGDGGTELRMSENFWGRGWRRIEKKLDA